MAQVKEDEGTQECTAWESVYNVNSTLLRIYRMSDGWVNQFL
jgi:hypothetical protein